MNKPTYCRCGLTALSDSLLDGGSEREEDDRSSHDVQSESTPG